MQTKLTKDILRAYLPPRPENGHKGTFGSALLFCGSPAYIGAATLACAGALRTGNGLTALCAPKEVCENALRAFPELVCIPKNNYSFSTSAAALAKATAVLVGCGCGVSDALHTFLKQLLLSNGSPVVLDADALNTLSRDRDDCKQLFANKRRNLILTPHPLEFSRLTGVDVATIQESREDVARTFAQFWNAVIVLKGAQTVIASPDGLVQTVPISTSALSKGGSGDVLAGVSTSFVAQGASPVAAACLGAYLHAKAGQTLSKEFSPYGVIPSDLPMQIARELNSLLS